jgi:Protein of unknown function (DUF3631)
MRPAMRPAFPSGLRPAASRQIPLNKAMRPAASRCVPAASRACVPCVPGVPTAPGTRTQHESTESPALRALAADICLTECDVDRLTTEQLLETLHQLDESPWSEFETEDDAP